MKKITITIPLDIALEIATYGEYGKVSRNTQHYMEKQVKQMGYEKELNDLRDQKLKASAENLSRILGSDVMNKIEESLKVAKDAMIVASRMNEKN